MQPDRNQIFIQSFFELGVPIPHLTQFSQLEIKTNDMKLVLEIATKSYLRMQSDPKTNLISFSCKNYGKSCFQIVAIKKDKSYLIESNYFIQTHDKSCELHKESFQYLKIYNLMKLKKNLIENYMIHNKLMGSSPSEILTQISQAQEYFFEKRINYNPEMRRKLRKRFDNIINIDVKKITKGGRQDQKEENNLKIMMSIQNNGNKKVQNNKWFTHQRSNCELKSEPLILSTDEKNKRCKNKFIKKFNKISRKCIKKRSSKKIEQKENISTPIKNFSSKKNDIKMEPQLFFNSQSQSQDQLKEIKQLKRQFNGFDQFFSWPSDDSPQIVEPQTINDKLSENICLTLRNSLLRKSLLIQSLQNFPEQNDQFNTFQDDEQMI